jgi:calcineurin-like phosphoesterase family protein
MADPAGSQADQEAASLPAGVRRLPDDTLLVFLSDTHIGGDPGCDIFESPAELAALLDDLAAHGGPVELVLAGDFFDFLAIGPAPAGTDRAAATIDRPEYRALFAALRRFAAGDGRRVVYLPGNHDAEVWWNPAIRATLRAAGLVDEFALAYAACFESAPGRVIYCEHGNQFDPANTIADYDDPLDTPLGHHIVADGTRRIVPRGHITRALDLRDVNKVYPLAALPAWIASRFFYDLLGRVVVLLLLPLLAASVAHAIFFSLPDLAPGWLPARVGVALLEVWYDALIIVVVFGLFFVAIRRTTRHAVVAMSAPLPGDGGDVWRSAGAPAAIRARLEAGRHPPMNRDLDGGQIAVFVSGHTHAPALSAFRRAGGEGGVLANSGCWLRQLRPIPAHFHGPPVFVPRFVLTHVQVALGPAGVVVELREQPKPAPPGLRLAERIAVLGRLPAPPAAHASPRIVAAIGSSDASSEPKPRLDDS